jgi:hypothetical protein
MTPWTVLAGATASLALSACGVSVNDGFRMGPGGSIAGTVICVTDGITLRNVQVRGDVATVTGRIDLSEGTRVRGAILVDVNDRGISIAMTDSSKRPEVVIGTGVVVDGGVRFEREGTLWIHEDATVAGEIEGVQVKRFSGLDFSFQPSVERSRIETLATCA